MTQESGSGGAVLMAFVLGAIAGASAALLWAPASGEETRRVIKERANEARDRANKAARQGREYVDRQRENLSTAIERGKEAYQRARSVEEQA